MGAKSYMFITMIASMSIGFAIENPFVAAPGMLIFAFFVLMIMSAGIGGIMK